MRKFTIILLIKVVLLPKSFMMLHYSNQDYEEIEFINDGIMQNLRA